LPGEQRLVDKVLLLMKTLYGMADELDAVDFFLQNAGSTENLFVQDDASADKNTQQADVYDCGKVL